VNLSDIGLCDLVSLNCKLEAGGEAQTGFDPFLFSRFCRVERVV